MCLNIQVPIDVVKVICKHFGFFRSTIEPMKDCIVHIQKVFFNPWRQDIGSTNVVDASTVGLGHWVLREVYTAFCVLEVYRPVFTVTTPYTDTKKDKSEGTT